MYGVDAVHGHNNVLGATKFPQQIGIGATWDPQVAEAMGESTATAVKATGPQWDFAPVEDISRDTRWGRYYETYSEDPYLAGSLGAATIQGLQKTGQVAPRSSTSAATPRRSRATTAPRRTWTRATSRTRSCPSYKAAVDAGARPLMANSGSVNGIPAHASHYLLTDLLRKQWGFKGVVVSDWDDVKACRPPYHLTDTYAGAVGHRGERRRRHGACCRRAASTTSSAGLLADVKSGKVSKARIDEAVVAHPDP